MYGVFAHVLDSFQLTFSMTTSCRILAVTWFQPMLAHANNLSPKRCLAARHILMAATLCGGAVSAYAQKEPDMFDMDLKTLMSIQIVPSADASARGLSVPYAGDEVATGGRIGILSTRDNMDTPFSVTNYTQKFAQNHEAASVGDIVQYDPAVRIARGFGNFQQVYMVRGLPIFSDDMTYNGLYGILPRQYLVAESIERVEVLRGPNAFLNGAPPSNSGLGGAIDVIPKRAPKEDLTVVTVGAPSYHQGYAAADIATRSKDGSFGVRFNAVDSAGRTPVHGNNSLNGESHNLLMAILGLDYQGSTLRVSSDVGYQDHRMDAAQPSVAIANNLLIPPAPDVAKNIAQPGTYSNERDFFSTIRAEYDFNRFVTGWIAGGSRNGNERSSLSAFLTVNDSAGNFTANRFDVAHEDMVATGELGIRVKLQTEEIRQTLTLSANAYRDNSSNAYVIYDPFADNIYQPTAVASPTAILFGRGKLHAPMVTSTRKSFSTAFVDEVAMLDQRLLLTLGARQQNAQSYDYDYDTGMELSHYSESRVTPIGALLYKLDPNISVYANFIEGLLIGDIAPDTNSNGVVANAGKSLKPYQAKQVEAGLKYNGNSLGAAISMFDIRVPLTGYNDQNDFAVVGYANHKGLELSVYGELNSSLKILGGISFLNTDVRGKSAIGAPRVQGNQSLEWNVPQLQGLYVNGQIMYTGAQYANAGNTQKVPSWSRLDLGVRYMTKTWDFRPLTIRASVENVTNQNYWASVGGYPGAGYLTIGKPRTVKIFASVKF
jgi:iron complex outermembrane receptor protein